MQYVFEISEFDSENLLTQVSESLRKRTEIISRQKYAKLWKYTDMLNSSDFLSSQNLQKRKRNSKITGIICIIVGLYLFIPGIIKSEELMGPLIMGAGLIIGGILSLFRSIKKRKNVFDRAAEVALMQNQLLQKDQISRVIFLENEMRFEINKNNFLDEEKVLYSSIDCIIEDKDIIFITYNNLYVLLQKRDLIEGEIDAFYEFISKKTTCFYSSTF